MSSRQRRMDRDRILDALEMQAGGFDLDKTAHAISTAVEAMLKQLEALKNRDYSPEASRAWRVDAQNLLREIAKDLKSPYQARAHRLVWEAMNVVDFLDIAKAAQLTSTLTNELYRLAEFAQGREDSRPGRGDSGWLSKLSDEQVKTVQAWVAESEG